MSSSNTTTTTVISLSVEETNTLRQQLGLAPLRGATTTNAVVTAAAAISTTTGTKEREDSNHHHNNNNDSGCLELSIRETNQLRAQLGLKPLQMTTTTTSSSSSSSRHDNNKNNDYKNNDNNHSLPQHAPAIHEGERQALRERLERVRLQRQLATNVQTQFATPALGTTDTDDDTTTTKQQHTQSWAQRMRAATHISSSSSSNNNTNNTAAVPLYQEDDLHGIHVRHTLAELPTDTTTILTLTDTPVLQLLQDNINDDDDEQPPTTELQNESLVQAQRGASTGGGGYVGYDDDEFDELGGGGTTISRRRPHDTTTTSQSATTPRGFQIGVVPLPPKEEANKDGDRRLRTMASRAISLAAADNVDARPSDYMTVQEYWIDQQQQQQRKRHQSKKSRSRRTTRSEENAETNRLDATTSLLEDLDATAVAGPRRNIRKRRHDDGDDDDPPRDAMEKEALTASTTGTAESLRSKRVRYEQVMAQGNVRSQQVFGKKQTPRSAMNDDDDDEPDDAFLNAAIEKARRWNRLKAMSSSTTAIKGADAVVAALQQANAATANNEETTSAFNGGGTTATGGNRITFQMDETHEFTRTLLARTEQMEREQARSKKKTMVATTPNNTGQQPLPDDSKSSGVVKEESVDVMDVDIQELAKDVKMDDITPQQYRIGLDGTTTAVPKIGRGVGGLLQLLQHSGELPAPKNEKPNQKEEMRGRAKDKRTYEDYEPLDLSKVVRIDERNATAKDRELASREVKLEYRDEHGRLLTRKEAFRDLSYQFHGYGSGKRKQEKKLQQIAREQAEARITSQQLNEGSVHTTFGALKETQRATGKAFVIHKT